MRDLDQVYFTQPYRDASASEALSVVAGSIDANRILNPSRITVGDCEVFGFRAMVGERRSSSYVAVVRGGEMVMHERVGEKYRHPEDVRPTVIGGKVYVVFGTGRGRGQIRVQQVDLEAMEMGPEIRAAYDNSFQREKNWIFFEDAGEVYALHSIAPVKLLKRTAVKDDEWVMEEELVHTHDPVPSLHIGSQGALVGDKLYFMAHRHYPWGEGDNVIYVGSLAFYSLRSQQVYVRPEVMFHDLRTLAGFGANNLGRTTSLTYFAGLEIDGDVRVSYGVNHRFCGFCSLDASWLESDKYIAPHLAVTTWEWESAKATSRAQQRNLALEAPVPELVTLAEKRAEVCEPCEFRTAPIRLKVMTGIGERHVYSVGCDKCQSCGNNLSLLTGSCREKKWDKIGEVA